MVNKCKHIWALLTVIEPMRIDDLVTKGLVVYFCQKCLEKKTEKYGL